MFYRFVAFSGNTEVNIGSNFPTQSLAIYFLKKKQPQITNFHFFFFFKFHLLVHI